MDFEYNDETKVSILKCIIRSSNQDDVLIATKLLKQLNLNREEFTNYCELEKNLKHLSDLNNDS